MDLCSRDNEGNLQTVKPPKKDCYSNAGFKVAIMNRKCYAKKGAGYLKILRLCSL